MAGHMLPSPSQDRIPNREGSLWAGKKSYMPTVFPGDQGNDQERVRKASEASLKAPGAPGQACQVPCCCPSEQARAPASITGWPSAPHRPLCAYLGSRALTQVLSQAAIILGG